MKFTILQRQQDTHNIGTKVERSNTDALDSRGKKLPSTIYTPTPFILGNLPRTEETLEPPPPMSPSAIGLSPPATIQADTAAFIESPKEVQNNLEKEMLMDKSHTNNGNNESIELKQKINGVKHSESPFPSKKIAKYDQRKEINIRFVKYYLHL